MLPEVITRSPSGSAAPSGAGGGPSPGPSSLGSALAATGRSFDKLAELGTASTLLGAAAVVWTSRGGDPAPVDDEDTDDERDPGEDG